LWFLGIGIIALLFTVFRTYWLLGRMKKDRERAVFDPVTPPKEEEL